MSSLTGGKLLSVPFSWVLRQYVQRIINYCPTIMVSIMISHYAASRDNQRWDAKQVSALKMRGQRITKTEIKNGPL